MLGNKNNMNITESTLRRIIREALITEARYTPQTLIDKGLRFRVKFKGNMVYVRCGKATGDEPSRGTLWVDRGGQPNSNGYGNLDQTFSGDGYGYGGYSFGDGYGNGYSFDKIPEEWLIDEISKQPTGG